MSANGFAISGLFLGALGVVGLGQLAWDIATTYLPNEQLRILDETLEETNEIFQGAVEDGLPVTKKDSLEMRLNEYDSLPLHWPFSQPVDLTWLQHSSGHRDPAG